MARRFGFLALVLLALFAAPAAHAQADGEPTGVWLTQAGDARVKVSKCGGGICGVIVWLKEPIDPATGKPAVDDKNPNPALAKRPMIGLPLFTGMRPAGPVSPIPIASRPPALPPRCDIVAVITVTM